MNTWNQPDVSAYGPGIGGTTSNGRSWLSTFIFEPRTSLGGGAGLGAGPGIVSLNFGFTDENLAKTFTGLNGATNYNRRWDLNVGAATLYTHYAMGYFNGLAA